MHPHVSGEAACRCQLKRMFAMSEKRTVRRTCWVSIYGVALVAVLMSPFWIAKALEPARSIAQRVGSIIVPTAAAAVIVPVDVTESISPVPARQFEAARLVAAGTMLFGLAAVVRKAI